MDSHSVNSTSNHTTITYSNHTSMVVLLAWPCMVKFPDGLEIVKLPAQPLHVKDEFEMSIVLYFFDILDSAHSERFNHLFPRMTFVFNCLKCERMRKTGSSFLSCPKVLCGRTQLLFIVTNSTGGGVGKGARSLCQLSSTWSCWAPAQGLAGLLAVVKPS